MESVKREYPAIDIAKFVMAILVVAIHVEPFTGEVAFLYNNCIARIADPLFFILTAYFMFDKSFNNKLSWDALKNYMIRIVKLYTCWVIIYLPIILWRTWDETGNLVNFMLSLLQKVLLKGPYGAMWFLTAILMAIPLTFIVTKYTKPFLCVLIAAPFFLMTVFQMEYTIWAEDVFWFQNIINYAESIFGWLANGLNYGFFFCSLGMYIAYLKRNHKELSLQKSLLFAILSMIALVFECYYIRINQTGISYGAMFFLIPTSYFLCCSLLQINLKPRPFYVFLRKSSILIFTIHYGVMEGLQYFAKIKGDFLWNSTSLYICVLGITIFLTVVIIKMSQYKYFSYLNNLY